MYIIMILVLSQCFIQAYIVAKLLININSFVSLPLGVGVNSNVYYNDISTIVVLYLGIYQRAFDMFLIRFQYSVKMSLIFRCHNALRGGASPRPLGRCIVLALRGGASPRPLGRCVTKRLLLWLPATSRSSALGFARTRHFTQRNILFCERCLPIQQRPCLAVILHNTVILWFRGSPMGVSP